jgi:D-sorbitol dehydrogenase (acceptor)
MPYTAYRGVSDSDIHALYIYLTKGIDPVDEAPRAKTNLPFPFNQRVVMASWNLLFNNGPIFSDADANAKGALRGKYLAETLAHCSTCHTPRNVFMAEDASRYLGGGDVGGWHAPNITSDPVSGIGGWTNEELVAYLKNGNAVGKSQAAGPMAEAVEHSFRHMPEADLMAIAEYLKTVPPLRSEGQTQPAFDRVTAKSVELGKLDYSINYDPKVMANGTSSDGQEIYVSACATCHQLNGNGTADHFYPSLTSNRATGGPTPNNLVMAIVEGVHRKTNGFTVQMPAFKDELSNAQIAAVSNYVLSRFGNDKLRVTEADVLTLKKGGDTPLLIKATPWLMGIAAFSGVLLILAFVGFLIHRRAAAVPSQV